MSSFSDIHTQLEQSLLNIVARECERWESFRIDAPAALASSLALIHARVPILKKLWINILYKDDIPSLNMFQVAPSLKQASVDTRYWKRPYTMQLPSEQLHRYEGSTTWNGQFNILQSAFNLRECAITVFHRSSESHPGNTISFPQLRQLSLQPSAFLTCFDAPVLQELYCDVSPDLLTFLQRSSARLQKLVLSSPISAIDFSRIFDIVPTIRDVGITPEDIDSLLLLTIRDGNADMAPALEHMSVDLSELAEFHESYEHHDRFLDMIESRWPGSVFCSVSVRWPQISSRARARIRVLRRQGFNFTFFGRYYSMSDLHRVPSYLRLSYAL
ncbi:hypothetical protein C8J57DRAFT_1627859 [Mycena rebaudengoi]|nr:hypothetical protein C8J57DRAFT_1627859 [Mycena rebaudengoi]